MINAREARELVESSTKKHQERLERIGKLITERATLGENTVIPQDWLYNSDEWLRIEKKPFYDADFDAIQKMAKKELNRLGFNVDLISRKFKVGGGFNSMDEQPKEEVQYVMQIRW